MSERDAVSDFVETAFEAEYLACLSDYTRIPCLSPSFDPDWEATGAIAKAARALCGFAEDRVLAGLSVSLEQLPGLTPVVLLELPATDRARAASTTLVYGHYDKQPPLGPWRPGLDAFEPVRDGDHLYGRGTADDGYAMFAILGALEGLAAAGRGHGRVVVLIEGSEESGSPHLEAYLDHLAPRIGSPSLVICLDSGCATYDRLWTTTSLRGVLVGTLRVDVLEEGVHSGHAGGIVPSPFRIARQLLSRIEDEDSGEILLEELSSEIPSHRRREIAEVAAEFGASAAGVFPLVRGVVLAGDVADRLEAGTWRPALSITGQEGLPPVPDGGNVLLPSVTLKLSLRLPPNCDAVAAGASLRHALEASPPNGAKVTVALESPAQGWDSPAPAPWLREALEDASRRRFGAPPRALGLGGSIPFMAALGQRYPEAEFLATGVLGPGSNAHGPNEFLHLPTVKALSCSVADVLAAAP